MGIASHLFCRRYWAASNVPYPCVLPWSLDPLRGTQKLRLYRRRRILLPPPPPSSSHSHSADTRPQHPLHKLSHFTHAVKMVKTRPAKPEDLPAVVKVILAAINKERLWTNFVPTKSSQDATYVQEIETLLKEHLDPSNKDWVIEVVDLAGKKDTANIVAVAVWDMSAAEDDDRKKREIKSNISDSRLSAYTEVVNKARTEFFNRYPQHMYLH